MVTDIETKGLYTTMIPLESLEDYEFECNESIPSEDIEPLSEVNVTITNSLIKDTSKVASGCNFINVVLDSIIEDSLGGYSSLVEVSFDLNEKKLKCSRKPSNRSRRVSPKEDYDKDDNDSDDDDDDDLSMLFGKLVKTPYLHYLFNSRIDYPINDSVLNEKYKTIVVKNPS